jgi:hypothetical protein
MAFITPRSREIELVKEAADRVAYRTRSRFVWNEKPPETESNSNDRSAGNQGSEVNPVQFD